jgi:hypothetical protein
MNFDSPISLGEDQAMEPHDAGLQVRMRSAVRNGLSAILLATVVCSPAAGRERPPDITTLAQVARETQEKLATTPATWTAVLQAAGNLPVTVEVLQKPKFRRLVMTATIEGKKRQIAVVFQRDGCWYVFEQGRAGKYRPFEATFQHILGYLYLIRAEARFVTGRSKLGKYEGTRSGIAMYRTTISPLSRKQMETWIAGAQSALERITDPVKKRGIEARMRELRGYLSEGFPLEVELSSGMVVHLGTHERQKQIAGFRWLEEVDDRQFAVEGVEWIDHTGDPTARNADDLAMIGYCGYWRTGAKSFEFDTCLIDVNTGRFRRVPFRGYATLPGCFSKDREKVFVSGMPDAGEMFRLYEINLRTGHNRRLGRRSLTGGHVLGPSLSPNGRTLAVIQITSETDPAARTQVHLVDILTGQSSRLGKPLDAAYLSWAPERRGLILGARIHQDGNAPPVPTVVRMDLQGEVTPIVPGSNPALIAGGEKILFLDDAAKLWKTCGVDGQDVKPFGDGMKNFHAPAPAPDGQRLLMMRYDPTRLPSDPEARPPVPVVMKLDGTDIRTVVEAVGLWGKPAWR